MSDLAIAMTTYSDTPPESKRIEILRLVGVFLLILGGDGAIVYVATLPEQHAAGGDAGTAIPSLPVIPGLSPAVQACYSTNSTISLLIISIAFGIAIGLAYFFGNFLYKKFRDSSIDERRKFWESVSGRLNDATPSELSEIISGFSEYEKLILDRRNLYWGLFLRAALAILVVSLIALLIGACKIESQAGLPIITGIISFVIGQGAEALHSAGTVLVINRTPLQREGHKTTVSTGLP
jgi:hypothetical protein